MRPHLGGKLRRLLASVALATSACVLLPGAPPRPTPEAEAAARAAWRALPSSSSACARSFDFFPKGGLVNFYCHAQSALTLDQLERLAGMASLVAPPADAPRNSVVRAFRNYDPRFVAWLRGALLPARYDRRFREETQPVYDQVVAPLARKWLGTRRLMLARRRWLDAEVRWTRSVLERGTLPERYYWRRYDLFERAAPSDDGTYRALDATARDGNVGTSAVAFWIRRELDGSAPAFTEALEELVAIYDAAWLGRGAGVVTVAPPPDQGPGRPAPEVGTVPDMEPEPTRSRGWDEPFTIARLFREREYQKGKRVELTGTVAKVYASAGRHWLHLRDGSGSPNTGDHDLVLMTSAPAMPGDAVRAWGTVAVDRSIDGWVYPLILEDAQVTKPPVPPPAAKTLAPPSRPPPPPAPAPPAAATPALPSAEDGAVVAEGKDLRITAADFSARMAEQSPFIRARYTTLERKREFLDNLIRFHLLAAEARRQGIETGADGRSLREQAQKGAASLRQRLPEPPDEEYLLDKLRTQTLVQRYFSIDRGPRPTDEETRAFYEQRRDEFVRPERCKLRVFRIPAPGDPARRDAALATAERLRRRFAGFPLPAADLTDPAPDTIAPLPDEALRTLEEASALYGAPVARTAFALPNQGDVTPVVEADDAFLVATLLARQPALSRSWEQVREQIAARLQREALSKDFDRFVAGLRAQAGIRVDEGVLERIVVK